jgi:hypothetical protein
MPQQLPNALILQIFDHKRLLTCIEASILQKFYDSKFIEADQVVMATDLLGISNQAYSSLVAAEDRSRYPIKVPVTAFLASAFYWSEKTRLKLDYKYEHGFTETIDFDTADCPEEESSDEIDENEYTLPHFALNIRI